MILLQVMDASWAKKALKTLKNNSPFNLEITYKLLNLKDTNSRESLIRDLRISWRLIEMPDFYEGVQAVLVDKDNAPHWHPERFDMVSQDEIVRCFEPFGIDEL